MERGQLLSEIKRRLQEAFGERLRGVVLYGSVARGDDRPDSDVDVLLLLDKPATTWEDVHTAYATLISFMLKIGKVIDIQVVDIRRYEECDAPLYAAARKEGIRA